MATRKTRGSKATHLSNVVGSGREFIPSQLPTHRDVLRLGIYFREQADKDKRNYPDSQLARDIVPALLGQWEKANAEFKFPVIAHKESLLQRVKRFWENAVNYSMGNGKLKDKENFNNKLDRLMDILHCHCPIQYCSELGCVKVGDEKCRRNGHIECKCEKQYKIPKIELEFVKSQREKRGIGGMGIGGVDRVESVRQIKHQANKAKEELDKEAALQRQVERERESRRLQELAKQFSEADIDDPTHEQPRDFDNNYVPEPEPEPLQVCSKAKKHNMKDIPNIALATMRHHTGLREAAEIVTGTLIDFEIVTAEDSHLVIDHNKIKRAQEVLTSKLNDEFEEEIKKKGISCIFFDGRRDDTKVMLECEDSEKQFPGLIKEEHYSVCEEPGGRYLFHFVPGEATSGKKHSEILADQIVEWLRERGQDQVLRAIGGDSTNPNTGWSGGAMHWVEVKLGRNLVWIVCDLHTGELPLRKLITELDGPTLSGNRWSGDVGNMLNSATELEINPNFEKIDIGPHLIQLRH